VCSIKERQQDVAADHFQLVSQNQRQTWWHQQYSAAQHPVCMLSMLYSQFVDGKYNVLYICKKIFTVTCDGIVH